MSNLALLLLTGHQHDQHQHHDMGCKCRDNATEAKQDLPNLVRQCGTPPRHRRHTTRPDGIFQHKDLQTTQKAAALEVSSLLRNDVKGGPRGGTAKVGILCDMRYEVGQP